MKNINSDIWRNGYAGTKSIFLSDRTSNLIRLNKLSFNCIMPKDSKILDFGCGNGNLIELLNSLNYKNVTGIEPDIELVKKSKVKNRIINCCPPPIPFPNNSFQAVISMAVLHHITSEKIMNEVIDEIYRIIKPGGYFFYVEPSETITRKVLTYLLLSPFSQLLSFSRKKRIMVLEEKDNLYRWLKNEKLFPKKLVKTGFIIEKIVRTPLKVFVRARK